MPINPAERAFIQSLKDGASQTNVKPPLAEQRENTKALFNTHAGEPATIPVMNYVITVRDGATILVRVFNPEAKGPTLFFLSGNGFAFDLFDCNAVAASRISDAGKFRVAIINLRLMPENSWATIINDVEDIMATMCQPSNTYGINPSTIYLAGTCSGTNIAMLVAARRNPNIHIKKLILLNGFYDLSLEQNSHEAFEQDDMVTRTVVLRLFEYWGITPETAKTPERSPFYLQDFSDYPDVTLLVGEYDALRSHTEALYIKLKEHHVTVSKIVLLGQTHNNMLLRGVMNDSKDPAEVIAEIVRAS